MPLASKTVATAASFPSFPSTKDQKAATGFNGVFFGPPGGGKTTLITSMKLYKPDEKILLFDLDVGRESVLDRDIDFVSGIEWPEIRKLLDTALSLKDESPYKTYAFDSLSSLYYQHIFPAAEKKLGAGKDGRQYYFEAQKMLVQFVIDAKKLSEYGINTLFTGHEVEDNDGDVVNVRLGLPQKVRNEVLLIVNHVGYLTRKKGSEVRELHMSPPRRVSGPKIRVTESNRKNVPLVFEDPKMGDILEALKKVS